MEEIDSPGKEEVGPTYPLISISAGQSYGPMPAILLNQPACLPGTGPGGSPSQVGAAHGQQKLSQGAGAWWVELEGGPPSLLPSSLQPNKQKLRRQPLEEMHVDVFINQLGGDQSSGHPQRGHQGPLTTLATIPELPTLRAAPDGLLPTLLIPLQRPLPSPHSLSLGNLNTGCRPLAPEELPFSPWLGLGWVVVMSRKCKV